VTQARTAFEALRGARIFVTGGTGFFGHWMLESLLRANGEMGLDVHTTVLTRDAAEFRKMSPWIVEDAAITLLEGDVRGFEFAAGAYSHVVHAATDSGEEQQQIPGAMASNVIEGTRRVLEFAKAAGAARMLYVSTGAVYGRSTTVLHTPEDFAMPVLSPGSYDASKRMAEELLLTENHGLEIVIARCFAFVGPRLPLDAHFAIGNFIDAAMKGETIRVSGDGTPRRSWMYMSDLATWLWTMLVRGENGRAYNVGSDEGYTIAEAARVTAETLRPELPIEIAGAPVADAPINSYVPSVERAKSELGLEIHVPLILGLRKTAAWYRGLSHAS
jgi:nucleoside-diphosphate-sugar epimerase